MSALTDLMAADVAWMAGSDGDFAIAAVLIPDGVADDSGQALQVLPGDAAPTIATLPHAQVEILAQTFVVDAAAAAVALRAALGLAVGAAVRQLDRADRIVITSGPLAGDYTVQTAAGDIGGAVLVQAVDTRALRGIMDGSLAQ